MHTTTTTATTLTLAATLLAAAPLAAAPASPSPNIIIIILDDMGYGDLTVTGATGYSTPNIDRLCAEGARFTNFYVPQPICSASRAAILTGCYPNRIGFGGRALLPGSKIGISSKEETIGTVLKKKNYTTAAIGKWHLGDQPKFLPTKHGFDTYYGIPYSNDMWPGHPTAKFPNLPLLLDDGVANPGLTAADQAQLTTQYTEHAIRFIEKNKTKPFFLYLAHTMPHVPLYVSDKFKGKSAQGLYGDIMMEIDWSVGQILATLARHHLDENTLIIFTSDNGPWLNYGNHAGSTGGLREGKATIYEGGIRVPCIMRWPAKIPAGAICNQLASTIDLLPTFAAITAAPLPPLKIDGINILPLLLAPGSTDSPRKHLLYYYRDNELHAVRDARFKLVYAHTGRTYEGFLPGADGKPGRTNENQTFKKALYDMRRDPGERYDVQDLYPEALAALEAIAAEARQDLGDDLTSIKGPNRRPAGRANE